MYFVHTISINICCLILYLFHPHNHNNLTIVCPNCHRRIEQNVICTDKLIKLSDVLDDNWKNYLPEKYR